MKDTNEYNPLLETIARLSQPTPLQTVDIIPTTNAALVPLVEPEKQVRNNFGDSSKPFQWKPGQSGNPLGRPKKEATVTSLVQEILDQTDSKSGKTHAMLIAEAMVKLALKDPQVLKELLNRTEGKVTEVVDMRTQAVSILYEMVKPKEDKDT